MRTASLRLPLKVSLNQPKSTPPKQPARRKGEETEEEEEEEVDVGSIGAHYYCTCYYSYSALLLHLLES
jgi:hypothetical protein